MFNIQYSIFNIQYSIFNIQYSIFNIQYSFNSQSRGKMVPVPNNWTSYSKPLEISVNEPCKDFLRHEAQTWYSDQIVEQAKAGKSPHEIKVGTQLSVVKP